MNITQSKRFRIFISILVFSLLFSFPTSALLSEEDIRLYSVNSINLYTSCDGTDSLGYSTVSGSTAREKIWSALKAAGFSDVIAAGAFGNMAHEGSMSPVRYEDSYKSTWTTYDYEHNGRESRGVGLIQWSFDRRVNLFKYLRENGGSDLVDKYLKHPEKYGSMSGDKFIEAADSESDANRLYELEVKFLAKEIDEGYSGLLKTTTAESAAEYFAVHVEGCSTCTAGTKNTNSRIDSAKQAFQEYSGQTAFASDLTSDYFGSAECGCMVQEGGSASSNVTWSEDGWIAGGIDGYKKSPAKGTQHLGDDAAGKQFATDMPNGKGRGPNKITLHSTETTNIGGADPIGIYGGTPPHFTIDLKNRRVFQHFSIYETSAAVMSHDDTAGVQIEIFGYSDADVAKNGGNSKWILSSFTQSEVEYLGELLRGISKATGIPLTSTVDWSGGRQTKRLSVSDFKNYQGILGHRHIPDNDHWDPYGIWDTASKILNAASSVASSSVEFISGGSESATNQIEDEGKNVTIIGDSITARVNQAGSFKSQLKNADIQAQSGKRMFGASQNNKSGEAVVKTLIKNHKLRSIVVIALGTNDGAIKKEDVQKLVDTINQDGVHTIVFVNNYIYKPDDDKSYTANNEVFTAIKNTNPNVIIADWAAAAGTNPDKYIDTSDNTGAHPTISEGTNLFASTIYKAITENFTSTQGYGDECLVSDIPSSDVQKLQETVKSFAWPDYHSKYYTTKKSAYEDALKEGGYKGAGCWGGGVDCGGFVYQVMSKSGWDPDFGNGTGYTIAVQNYMNSSSKWQDVTSTIKSNADAKPGDVILSSGHILLFVGDIDGFNGVMASASMCERAPMADHAKDISSYVKQGYKIWRKS